MENDCDEKHCGDCCVLFSDRDEDSVASGNVIQLSRDVRVGV